MLNNPVILELTKEQFNLMNQIIKKYTCDLDGGNNKEYNFEKEINNIIINKDKVVSILKKVYQEFKIFKDYAVEIVLTGSYARGTNRIDSDLDLHFIYSNKYKKDLYIYEELYMYTIAQILNIKRERIHSVITTKLKNEEIILDDKPLKVILKYQTWISSYEYYPNTKKRFYLEYLNSKSSTSFFKYLEKEIKGLNREWTHNFLVISNFSFNDKYEKLIQVEKEYLTKNNIDKLIEHLLTRLNEKDLEINLKKKYQVNMYYNIYNTLEVVRLKLIKDGYDIPIFNLIEFYNNKYFLEYVKKNNFKLIYNYLYLVKKMSLKISQDNEIFSIHVDNDLNKYLDSEIINLYNTLTNILKEILLNVRGDLND